MNKLLDLYSGMIGVVVLVVGIVYRMAAPESWLATAVVGLGVFMVAFPLRIFWQRRRLKTRGVDVMARISPAEGLAINEEIRPWNLTAMHRGRELQVRVWLHEATLRQVARDGLIPLRIDPYHPKDFYLHPPPPPPPSTPGQRRLAAVLIPGVIGFLLFLYYYMA